MEALAQWAEPVLMTAEEFLRLPEDEWLYELVEGRLVRVSPAGARHGRIVMALLLAVWRFVCAISPVPMGRTMTRAYNLGGPGPTVSGIHCAWA